ncbi:hypothetical protein QS306_11610 [Paraburkholderia bonniea]|uniref:hypothetical protein n=1 Tax=Paraburkholderia bonniea TaxID=2152891 RepID=UPI0025736D8E|nr:hypothetical protein [Paraburkholderia bonniea]WJF89744.1 hypothetical protein QS306_11610 [Paraburkholderia bonniea]WJF93058.1 hypothetical protein QS308_11620 [Paraburkholderia bonniea]
MRELGPVWLPAGEELGDRRKGNLGEFIAFHVSEAYGLSGEGYYCDLGNANKPLAAASDPGLDIVFVHLDPGGNAANDRLYIQEVKTTGDHRLTYAAALVADHVKLQERDSDLNLQSRILALKGTLKYQFKLAQPYLDRLEALGHPDAQRCERVVFLPTLVHEKVGADPITRLAEVKLRIAELGWPLTNIFPRSIALTRLNEGLLFLATNQVFEP